MLQGRIRMAEVADMAGVSQATVSLVLTNAPNTRISEATRERVVEAARKLGYRRRGRFSPEGSIPRVIGLLINDVLSSPFVFQFVAGATDQAADHGVILVTISTDGNQAQEAEAIKLLNAVSAEGVVYSSAKFQEMDDLPGFFDRASVVMLNCSERTNGRPSVVVGDFQGAFAATKTLIDARHRRIAHMTGDPAHFSSRERERGFRAAMADAGIAIDESLVVIGGRPLRTALVGASDNLLPSDRPMASTMGWTIPAAREVAEALLSRPDRPTAIFCFFDRMASACYDVAKKLGLSIPGDLSIVGFDDEFFAEALDPPLTTVELPHYEMAAQAVDILVNAKPGTTGEVSTVVQGRLIERQSVAAPKG